MTLIAVSLFLITILNSISAINLNEGNYQTNNGICELPEWSNGTYWKYDMNFIFIKDDFIVDAVINNMCARVEGDNLIQDEVSDKVYELSLNGGIKGNLSWGILDDIASFNGDFGGTAYIGKNNLGIKRFEFDVNDEEFLFGAGLDFEMSMGFEPCFDFFNFPIDPSDPEGWDVFLNAFLDATVNIGVPFGYMEMNDSMFFSDYMTVNRTEKVGIYDTAVLQGSWGNPSNLWYANDAGFLVQVDETLDWGGIYSIFQIDLIETNYGNSPPSKPNLNSVEDKCTGETGDTFTFNFDATDPEGENVKYYVDWDDGTNTDWTSSYPSGQKASASHSWSRKGSYTIRVKAKDESGVESCWSDPYSITIEGKPYVNVTIIRIEKIDEMDAGAPEWYYEVSAKDSATSPKTFYNTDDGTENGEWISSDTWDPDRSHDFEAPGNVVDINVKLMEKDPEGYDIADISKEPNEDKDPTYGGTRKEKGRVLEIDYDLLANRQEIIIESTGEEREEEGNDGEGNSGPGEDQIFHAHEDDAYIKLSIKNDYIQPTAIANISNRPEKIRPGDVLQFSGSVNDGTPPYKFDWDFKDGTTEEENQNPTHSYDTDETKNYNVELTVTDGFGQKATSFINFDVENRKPDLTNDNVTKEGDLFIFSVHYEDLDGDSPTVKKLILDNVEYTLSGSGSNSKYQKYFDKSDITRGDHTYYFHFEDGYGGVAETDEEGFRHGRSKIKSNTKFNFIFDISKFTGFKNLRLFLENLYIYIYKFK